MRREVTGITVCLFEEKKLISTRFFEEEVDGRVFLLSNPELLGVDLSEL